MSLILKEFLLEEAKEWRILLWEEAQFKQYIEKIQEKLRNTLKKHHFSSKLTSLKTF